MATYNHEEFIEMAVEGVLKQKTSFPFELIVGEDCSPDKTRAIIEKYALNHPDRMRLILHPKNVGGHANFTAILNACQGEYIAYLDGDDFWIADDKLQRQFDLMESNKGCSLSYHNVYLRYESDLARIETAYPEHVGRECTLEDLVRHNSLYPCSVMFRASIWREYPNIRMFDLAMGDWPLWIRCAQTGKICYIDSVMATYRSHPGGAWSTASALKNIEKMIHAISSMKESLGLDAQLVTSSIVGFRRQGIDAALKSNDFASALQNCGHIIALAIKWRNPPVISEMYYCLRVFLRYIYHYARRKVLSVGSLFKTCHE